MSLALPKGKNKQESRKTNRQSKTGTHWNMRTNTKHKEIKSQSDTTKPTGPQQDPVGEMCWVFFSRTVFLVLMK